MTQLQIIIFSVSLSFCVTQVWKPVNFKPFNCMMCLTGWVAMITAFNQYELAAVLFFPVGCFVGAVTESLMMRYL